jgi:hypothetical protein
MKEDEMAGHVVFMGGKRSACKVLVGEPEGRRPLRRPRHRWEDSIKMDLEEIGLDWIHLAQDRDHCRALMNMIMYILVP